VKDDGYWSVRMLPNGDVHWRSRWGTERVTHPAMRPPPRKEPSLF
jgi:hypothetical protein